MYLEDYVRAMEAHQTVKDVQYVLALQLLGVINHVETRAIEAERYWARASSMIDDFRYQRSSS